MKKRIICVLFSIAMTITLLPSVVHAAIPSSAVPTAIMELIEDPVAKGQEIFGTPLTAMAYFEADLTGEEAEEIGYGDWIADFYLSISDIENGTTLKCDGCTVVGGVLFDDGYIWKNGVDLYGDIEVGVEYPVVGGAFGGALDFYTVCGFVRKFYAGLYVPDSILSQNPNMKIKLSLRVTDPDNPDNVMTVGDAALYSVESTSNGYIMTGERLPVDATFTPPAHPHVHCTCGENITATYGLNRSAVGNGHTHTEEELQWRALTANMPSTPGSYYLANDITIDETWLVSGGEYNLCLNGYDIKYVGAENGSVIKIESGATLNLCDCSTRERYGKFVENGGETTYQILTEASTGEYDVIVGGIITGGTGTLNDSCGGGVYNSGTFNMMGGNIAGNTAEYGTAVYNTGTFTMYDGKIAGNIGGTGAGVFNSGLFVMIGGSITGNKATDQGGGVYNDGKMILSGTPTIKSNTAGSAVSNICIVNDSCGLVEVDADIDNDGNADFVPTDDIGLTLTEGIGMGNAVTFADEAVASNYQQCFYSEAGFPQKTDGEHLYFGGKVITQPTKDNNYTVEVDISSGANYQWHEGSLTTKTVIEPGDQANGNEVSARNVIKGRFDANNLTWHAKDESADGEGYQISVGVSVKTGDIIVITPIVTQGYDARDIDCQIDSVYNAAYHDDSQTWTIAINEDNEILNCSLKSNFDFDAKIEIQHFEKGNALDSQTSECLDTGSLFRGYYVCDVTWDTGYFASSNYASYVAYRVTYDYDEIDNMANEEVIVPPGAILDLDAPVIDGYVFIGWYSNEARTLVYIDAPVNADTTLYAKYIRLLEKTVEKIERPDPTKPEYKITYTNGDEEFITLENGVDGIDGREVEFNVSDTHIRWRYVGENSWRELIELDDLKGDQGDKGDTGATGATGAAGATGATGANGADGVGISKIEKTSSEGNVDTYTITLTNGNTYTFTVTNGTNGKDGIDGKDGVDGKNGIDGKDGADGKDGIDGTDGKDGVDGKDGINGTDGKDGLTPFIGENGNWWIGNTDTGVKVAGADGKDGAVIAATAVGGTALVSNIALIAWILLKKKKPF